MNRCSRRSVVVLVGIAFSVAWMGCSKADSVRVGEQNQDSLSAKEFDRIVWTNQSRIRMDWVPSIGRDPSKTETESTLVVRRGLDSSATNLAIWSTLSLVRLHGEMGWTCRDCGYVLNKSDAKVAIQMIGTEYVAQARTPEGTLVGWMTTDTVSRWSLNYFIDREFLRKDDSSSTAFRSQIRRDGREYVRRKNAGVPEPRERKWILREADLLGQFSHFSSRVIDPDLDDYLFRLDTASIDSVSVSEQVSKAKLRRIQPEELDVLGLAATIGMLSKSCYRRISNGEISFRTRRTGSWRVTSAWNSNGKPVAWDALDTASDFQFPIWFHLDRQACLETTDSVSARPSFLHRLFHF